MADGSVRAGIRQRNRLGLFGPVGYVWSRRGSRFVCRRLNAAGSTPVIDAGLDPSPSIDCLAELPVTPWSAEAGLRRHPSDGTHPNYLELSVKFRAIVELGGKTATGLEVPLDIVEGLASNKRPAVRVTINGYTYRSTVATMGGRYMIPLSAENRAAAGVTAGDEVTVGVELDTQPREVTVPADLAAALDADPVATRTFDQLSYSRKRWHILSVEGAKTAETRRRRIEKSLALLREG